ncbi:MAG: hypothetical protein P4L22_02555 [Candidatus Babeliales bacterium]|nr:hypothetical protein [Candidatus Babeliales bacterium]
MAEKKKQPGFYERSGEQDNTKKATENKVKEVHGGENCKKCSKFENKSKDNCKCSSRYSEARKNKQL